MSDRMNAYSMAQPDPFGNMFGSMVPAGAIQPTSDLAQKKKLAKLTEDLEKKDPNYQQGIGFNRAAAENSLAQKIEEPEKPKYELNAVGSAAGVAGGAMAGSKMGETWHTDGKMGNMSAKDSKIAGGIAGAATTAAAIGGDYATKKGNEALGGALSGAAMGASMGSVAGPAGTAIGAVVGGVAGGVTGALKKKKRLLMEKEQKAEMDKYNKSVDEINRKKLGQADDLDRYQQVLQSVNSKSYEKGGKISYKRSGLLRYSHLDVNAGLAYIDSLKVERKKNGGKLANTPIIKTEKFQNGGEVMGKEQMHKMMSAIKAGLEKGMKPAEIAKKLGVSEEVIGKAISMMNPGNARKVQEAAAQAPMFKKGGKTESCKKGGKCGCKKCGTTGLTMIFRRGGVVDITKQSVYITEFHIYIHRLCFNFRQVNGVVNHI